MHIILASTASYPRRRVDAARATDQTWRLEVATDGSAKDRPTLTRSDRRTCLPRHAPDDFRTDPAFEVGRGAGTHRRRETGCDCRRDRASGVGWDRETFSRRRIEDDSTPALKRAIDAGRRTWNRTWRRCGCWTVVAPEERRWSDSERRVPTPICRFGRGRGSAVVAGRKTSCSIWSADDCPTARVRATPTWRRRNCLERSRRGCSTDAALWAGSARSRVGAEAFEVRMRRASATSSARRESRKPHRSVCRWLGFRLTRCVSPADPESRPEVVVRRCRRPYSVRRRRDHRLPETAEVAWPFDLGSGRQGRSSTNIQATKTTKDSWQRCAGLSVYQAKPRCRYRWREMSGRCRGTVNGALWRAQTFGTKGRRTDSRIGWRAPYSHTSLQSTRQWAALHTPYNLVWAYWTHKKSL